MKIIDGELYYTPREISKAKVLTSRADPNERVEHYESVLRIIREGKLKTMDIGKGKTPYYIVSARELSRYNHGNPTWTTRG